MSNSRPNPSSEGASIARFLREMADSNVRRAGRMYAVANHYDPEGCKEDEMSRAARIVGELSRRLELANAAAGRAAESASQLRDENQRLAAELAAVQAAPTEDAADKAALDAAELLLGLPADPTGAPPEPAPVDDPPAAGARASLLDMIPADEMVA